MERDKQNIHYAFLIYLQLNLSALDTQCIQIHWVGHFEVSCLDPIFFFFPFFKKLIFGCIGSSLLRVGFL